MSRRATATVSILAWAACSGAGAQDGARTAISQMNEDAPGRSSATAAPQIVSNGTVDPVGVSSGSPDRRVSGSAAPGARSALPTQLVAAAASADASPQLSIAGGGVGPAPSAEARAAGRIIAVVRPHGPDRCDPQSGRSLPAACARVIETRAQDFPAPDPQPLSAEQRLLATQRQLQPVSSNVDATTRRLANGQMDDSTAALAVASSALQTRSASPEEEEGPGEAGLALDAVIAGISALVTGLPPTP